MPTPGCLRCLSPPAKYAGITDLKHRAAASTVTLGRDSKMIPTTPRGTRAPDLNTRGAIGSVAHRTTGSGSAAIWRSPSIIRSRQGPNEDDYMGASRPRALPSGQVLGIGGLEKGPSPADAVPLRRAGRHFSSCGRLGNGPGSIPGPRCRVLKTVASESTVSLSLMSHVCVARSIAAPLGPVRFPKLIKLDAYSVEHLQRIDLGKERLLKPRREGQQLR